MDEGLDREYAIWVTRDELGKKKEIHLEGSLVTFTVPPHIDGHVVLRLKGLGHRRGGQKGNLLVRINLMEEERGSASWSPFRRTRQQQAGSGFEPFFRMQRRGYPSGGAGAGMPAAPQEPMDDPGRMRRAGYLIAGAGLVLVSGGFMGILPPAAWSGMIIVVAGIVVAFFA